MLLYSSSGQSVPQHHCNSIYKVVLVIRHHLCWNFPHSQIFLSFSVYVYVPYCPLYN
jgi:hypothetical protein